MRRFSAYAIVFTLAHIVVQFFAWSAAPGNTARPEAAIRWLWPMVSFPSFYVAPPSTATAMFWPLFIGNSAIWGIFATVAVSALQDSNRRRERFLERAGIHMRDENNEHRIVIRPNSSRHVTVLFGLFFLVWLCAGSTTFETVAHAPMPVRLGWFMLWLAATVLALYALLRRTVFSEVIVHSDSVFVLETRFGPLKRSRSFSPEAIRGLRLEEKVQRAKGHDYVTRILAFDYGKETVRLRGHLSMKEGDELLNGPLHRFV